MTPTLLVPIDFSSNARIAANYATTLARQMNMRVHVIHAYRPFTSAFQSRQANQTNERQARQQADTQLAEFVEKLDPSGGQRISSSTAAGSVLAVVNDYIARNPVALVVMGAHGASGPGHELLGNNTYDVAKDVSRPLLIVPQRTSTAPVKKTVFFTNYQAGDSKTLRSFQRLFKNHASDCALVHIHEANDGQQTAAQQKLDEWKKNLGKETAFPISYTELVYAPQEIEETVPLVLQRLQADMVLITLVDDRNFFKKVFQKSLARNIILNPTVPVLLTSEDTDMA